MWEQKEKEYRAKVFTPPLETDKTQGLRLCQEVPDFAAVFLFFLLGRSAWCVSCS